MGQRLNIEIVNGETSLANSYYHWSGYTDSALSLTKKIINAYYQSIDIVGLIMAVRLLEETDAGINEEERKLIDEKYPEKFGRIPFKRCVDRNSGLIAVTEEGKEATRKWEEGRVTIDLASETFIFDVVYYFSREECKEYYDIDTENFPECEYDLSCVPFDAIDDLIRIFNNNKEGVIANDEDLVICWI